MAPEPQWRNAADLGEDGYAKEPPQVFLPCIDAQGQDSDWLKTRTWDILPPTCDTLLDTLGVLHADRKAQRAAVHHFLSLPAAAAMPVGIAKELVRRQLLPHHKE